jgi:hypothetical protein
MVNGIGPNAMFHFTINIAMKNMYVQVTEQDLHNIDINDLVHQGLLFMLVKPTRNIESIIRYVGRIDDCASPAYRSCITQLWQEILCSPKIKPKLFITKGKNKGNPNYYFITAIVEILLQNNVYDNKKYSLMALWRIMKNSNDNIHFYTSSQVYFTHELVIIIREIMITYLQKLTENIK